MGISRRQFLGNSAAAMVAAGTIGTSAAFGANGRVNLCVCGVNGRGKSHIDGFGSLPDCDVVAICDPDKKVLDARARAIKKTTGKDVKTFTDVRDVLADGSIDAISIATPNHWHSLMVIWGVQAGKDVYVEKPLSHNIWEGRQLAEAVAKSDRIVQHGTQGRSSSTWLRDIKLLQDGFIGNMHTAKGFTYKTGNRRSLGYTEAESAPRNLDWNLWQGPASEQPYKKNYVHYNWHWFWHYGNGETGNQGVHQMDIAVWGMNKGLPIRVSSAGGRYAWDDEADTPNTQLSQFVYEDGTTLQFEVRNLGSYEEAGNVTGNTFLCNDGYYVEDKGFFNYNNEPIPVDAEKPESHGPWGNFIKACTTRDKSHIHGTALEGHLSCAHCHLGNIAYQLGRSLEFDPKTERFVNDDEANAMVSRDYRKEFEVPQIAT